MAINNSDIKLFESQSRTDEKTSGGQVLFFSWPIFFNYLVILKPGRMGEIEVD